MIEQIQTELPPVVDSDEHEGEDPSVADAYYPQSEDGSQGKG